MNVTQTSTANMGSVNNGATVTSSGSPTFGQPACTLPPVFEPPADATASAERPTKGDQSPRRRASTRT